MPSPVERDWVLRHWWQILMAILALVTLEAFALVWATPNPGWNRRLLWSILGAVVPNFIAGVVAAVSLHFLKIENDRTQYVKSMRALRRAVAAHGTALKIEPKQIQNLMQQIVPQVALLYFGKDRPPLSTREAANNAKAKPCGTCGLNTNVEQGRCELCKDSLDSWLARVNIR